jgi:hypothetical protein
MHMVLFVPVLARHALRLGPFQAHGYRLDAIPGTHGYLQGMV